MKFVVIIALILYIHNSKCDKPCAKKQYGSNKLVCVCNQSYCDEVSEIGKIKNSQVVIFKSSESGKRFEKSFQYFKDPAQVSSTKRQKIKINAQRKYQTILGFGGAFTDSAGININSLSEDTQKHLLASYFSKEGIQYSTARVPIASCDFSTREYSYDDIDGDFDLKEFSLTDEDLKLKIPQIKQALNLTNGQLKIFASPWSAPGWMKTNGRMKGGGTLKGNSSGPYHITWAKYFLKFIESYHKEGISIWAVTVQNEPTTGVDLFYSFQTMYFNAMTESDFVRDHLGPTLRSSSIGKDVGIIIMDDQRTQLPQWPDRVLRDPEARQYVSGIGVHWYLDFVSASRLSETHNRHPDIFILATEACTGSIPLFRGPSMGEWSRAVSYAKNIIEDLKNWVVGWTDWNICLDLQGGPNWVENFVDSPIIVNATADEFYKQPMFYAMGHFSKFIRPGYTRIDMLIDELKVPYDGVAFSGRDSRRIVVLNNPDLEKTFHLTIEDASNISFDVDLEPRSILTVIWNK